MFRMREIDFNGLLVGCEPDVWGLRSIDDAVMLSPAGELDFDMADEFDRRLSDLVASADTPLVLIDLSAVDFIDACCVSVIVRARAAARRRGRELYVQGLRGVPARVFDALGLRDVLALPATREGSGR